MKKNLLIFSIASIIYFFTKIIVLFLITPVNVSITFYSVTACINIILYIVIFIKLFKIMRHRKLISLHNFVKNLYSISI